MTKLIRLRGRSKLASVYQGTTELGRNVAVKELAPHVRDNPRLRDRLYQAARHWVTLIPTCWDTLTLIRRTDGSSPIGCHASGGDPTGFPAGALRILRQSLQAIDCINKSGFSHGNIKPSNLLLDGRDQVRLCDGLLIPLNDPGVIPSIVTPKYMAPETDRCSGHRAWTGNRSVCTWLYRSCRLGGTSFQLLPGFQRSDRRRHCLAAVAFQLDVSLPPTTQLVPAVQKNLASSWIECC
ncbi:MAG: hypothetical protein R3C05_12650 [Pirellulaceae bacterium]